MVSCFHFYGFMLGFLFITTVQSILGSSQILVGSFIKQARQRGIACAFDRDFLGVLFYAEKQGTFFCRPKTLNALINKAFLLAWLLKSPTKICEEPNFINLNK